MKKLFNLFLIAALGLVFFSSCENKGDISISHSETHDLYKFTARYPERFTKEVQQYLDEELENESDFSFENARLDADMVLDNKMAFYIRMYPGSLKIEMDKTKNSYKNYARMKKMGEGLGKILKDENQ
ncbi:hypothetical protein [Emticicia fluvialis]|uniref:hypothetical protein n=1 Tax=Emticicia fluvialis TaxID=2974474 RepID=UPI00216643E9|nr:hypothetical protein [Emticicia fluvialis]